MTVFDEMGFNLDEVNPDEELLYNVAVTHLYLTKIFAQFYRQFGMSLARFNALVLIDRLGGDEGLSQRETSEKLIVSGANVTGLIDRLERDGLVTRVTDTHDRRMNRIKTTDRGKALIQELWPKHLEKVSALLVGVSASAREATISCLTIVRAGAKRALAEGDRAEQQYAGG